MDIHQRFVECALRRKKLFLALSIVGIVIAVVRAADYGFRWLNDPTFPIGPRAVIVRARRKLDVQSPRS